MFTFACNSGESSSGIYKNTCFSQRDLNDPVIKAPLRNTSVEHNEN